MGTSDKKRSKITSNSQNRVSKMRGLAPFLAAGNFRVSIPVCTSLNQPASFSAVGLGSWRVMPSAALGPGSRVAGHYGTAEARGCRLQTPLTPLRTPLRNICNQCAVTRISPSVKNISRILISHFSNENTIVGAVKMAMYCLDFKDFKMSWKLLGIVCASTALRVTPGNDAIVWPRNITRITNKRSKGIRRSKNFDDILQFGWILSTKALPPCYLTARTARM